MDQARLGGYAAPFSQQLQHSQSAENSGSPSSSYNSRLAQPTEQPLAPSIQTPGSFESVLTHISASSQMPPAGGALPFKSIEKSAIYTLPPLSMSPLESASYTPHSDRTQHEARKEDPILYKVHRESTDLVSSYLEGQARIAELDKTVHASNLELGKLFKDRQSLKAKLDVLEAELDEIQLSTAQSQQYAAAKDAQYSQMLKLSTRLQTQALQDKQQHKVEHEQWEREKQDMQQTILNLTMEVQALRKGYAGALQSVQRPGDGSATMSSMKQAQMLTPTLPVQLDEEITILRHVNSVMEDTLGKVCREHAQLSENVPRLGGISRDMKQQLQSINKEESTLSPIHLGKGPNVRDRNHSF